MSVHFLELLEYNKKSVINIAQTCSGQIKASAQHNSRLCRKKHHHHGGVCTWKEPAIFYTSSKWLFGDHHHFHQPVLQCNNPKCCIKAVCQSWLALTAQETLHVKTSLRKLILQRVKVKHVPKTGWKRPVLALEKQLKKLLQLLQM